MLDRVIRLFFSSLAPTSLHLRFSRIDVAPRNREKWLFITVSPAVPDDRFPADFTAGTHARLAFFFSLFETRSRFSDRLVGAMVKLSMSRTAARKPASQAGFDKLQRKLVRWVKNDRGSVGDLDETKLNEA